MTKQSLQQKIARLCEQGPVTIEHSGDRFVVSMQRTRICAVTAEHENLTKAIEALLNGS